MDYADLAEIAVGALWGVAPDPNNHPDHRSPVHRDPSGVPVDPGAGHHEPHGAGHQRFCLPIAVRESQGVVERPSGGHSGL